MDLRLSAVLIAVPVAVLGAVGTWTDSAAPWFSHGPLQVGHDAVACRDCHRPSPGTIRQQIQARVAHALGQRPDDADFGRAAVSSEACLDCHARPNERHPVYRFREPRFIEALKVVQADSCLGCHGEHAAARVAAEPTFCRACHADLKLARDPVDIPHATLIAADKWGTCLACHDFHGNHVHEPPTRVSEMAHSADLADYFAQGRSPYGPFKLYDARAE